MLFSIFVMAVQLGFGIWQLTVLSEFLWDEALLINWYHLLKILINLYVTQSFMKTIKARKASSPMTSLSVYLTLFMYYAFLFLYKDLLPRKIPVSSLYLLSVYPATDWFCVIFSWLMLRGIIKRRDILLASKVNSVSSQKKSDDMFDIRYLPEEYLSDIQEDSEDEN